MANANKGTKMSQMSRYVVYQLPESHAKIRDLSFMDAVEIEAISDEFKVVAIVDARSLDEVFRIGNFIVEEDSTLIDLVCDDMHSVSVGDIIHNITTNETHVVARFGFTQINMKEAA